MQNREMEDGGYIEHYKNRNVSKCLISNRNLDKAKMAIFGTSKSGERLVNTGYFKI